MLAVPRGCRLRSASSEFEHVLWTRHSTRSKILCKTPMRLFLVTDPMCNDELLTCFQQQEFFLVNVHSVVVMVLSRHVNSLFDVATNFTSIHEAAFHGVQKNTTSNRLTLHRHLVSLLWLVSWSCFDRWHSYSSCPLTPFPPFSEIAEVIACDHRFVCDNSIGRQQNTHAINLQSQSYRSSSSSSSS